MSGIESQIDQAMAQPAPSSREDSGSIESSIDHEIKQEKYGTIGQQALSIAEGLGHGFAGPVATGAEALLTKAGVHGLTPEDQAARAETNPGEHYGSEATGFIAPLILSGGLSGEARAALEAGEVGSNVLRGTSTVAKLARNATVPGLVGQVGEKAAALTGLGGEGASALSKIAANGIKTGAEVGALQAGEEASKLINQDPNQTLGSAAINVGLSTLLGGAGGVALGGVSSLFRGSLEKAEKFINDAKEQVSLRQTFKDIPKILSEPEAALEPSVQSTKQVYDPFTKTSRQVSEPAIQTIEPRTQTYDPFTKTFIGSAKETPVAIPEVIAPPKGRTLGARAGDFIFDKGADALSKITGKTIGGAIGSIGGSLLGHPLFGAYIGEKTLGPIIDSLAKPMLEGVTNGAALKSSIDYLANSIKGGNTLSNSVNAFFKSSEIIPKHLLPDEGSREKLEKSLAHIGNFDDAMQAGGDLGHYMPNHSAAVASLTAQTKNYFDSIKPKSVLMNPLDTPSPISKSAQAKYNRALDVAQQPLLVLKHAKNGTLLPQDVQTLQAIYPGLHKSMVQELSNEMISHTSKGQPIPYHERVALSLLMGTNFDSTMTPANMQNIIATAGAQQESHQAAQKQKKASGVELRQIDKTNALYATRSQAQEIRHRA